MILSEIQDLINKCHNTNLVIHSQSPSENRIFHIYSDGEITHQKGSWAYLDRHEFTQLQPIHNLHKDLLSLNFPKKRGEFTYAIVTEEHAIHIRNTMIDFTNNLIKNIYEDNIK
jgi:hypothetical protein